MPEGLLFALCALPTANRRPAARLLAPAPSAPLSCRKEAEEARLALRRSRSMCILASPLERHCLSPALCITATACSFRVCLQAAEENDLPCLELLLEAGADVEATDAQRNTALHAVAGQREKASLGGGDGWGTGTEPCTVCVGHVAACGGACRGCLGHGRLAALLTYLGSVWVLHRSTPAGWRGVHCCGGTALRAGTAGKRWQAGGGERAGETRTIVCARAVGPASLLLPTLHTNHLLCPHPSPPSPHPCLQLVTTPHTHTPTPTPHPPTHHTHTMPAAGHPAQPGVLPAL